MQNRTRRESASRPPPIVETRHTMRYIGKPHLFVTGVRGRRMIMSQRAFAPPKGSHVIRWSTEDQTEAVDRGFFIERCYDDNHARVIPVRGAYPTDAAVMVELERLAFRRDAFAARALAFIEQQDCYRWSGTWDERVSRWTSQLRWYQIIKENERAAREARSHHYSVISLQRKRFSNAAAVSV